MSIFLITLAVFAAVILAMSVGVMMGREPIAGSCGGTKKLQEMGLTDECEICGGDPNKCENQQDEVEKAQADLAYDASTVKTSNNESR